MNLRELLQRNTEFGKTHQYAGSSNLAGQCPVSGFLGAPGVWGP
jgi:hypothetical protein